jgi:hypothetical protein
MLTKTAYTVSTDLLQQAIDCLPNNDFRLAINQPTGNFFYDPWEIKPEYKDTVWNILYQSLPTTAGEARIVNLAPGTCYQVHADIDDRYHLNVGGEECYLIDLDNKEMHKLSSDGIWYEMDAGRLHTAANFGRRQRIQLVVRKLLINPDFDNAVSIRITSSGYSKDDARFVFDNTLSNWLNLANKQNYIKDFKFGSNEVTFKIDETQLDELRAHATTGFHIEVL